MLVFHTVVPIKKSVTRRDCLDLFISWVTGNRYMPFTNKDFDELDRDSYTDFEVTKGTYHFSVTNYHDDETEIIACKLRQNEHEVWETSNVCVRTKESFELHVHTSYTGRTVTGTAPVPKAPFTIKLFLRAGYLDNDASLPVSDKPISMTDEMVETIGLVMKGEWFNKLPLVYVSKDYWPTQLDVADLAARLQGMAHVVIEETTGISFKLKEASDSRNVFRGYLGVYLPGEKKYNRRFSLDTTNTPVEELVFDIVGTVRGALLNVDEATKFDWDYVQSLKSRQRIRRLEKSNLDLSEMKEMSDMFEEENEYLSNAIIELKKEKKQLYEENERLKDMLSIYRSAGAQAQSMLLKSGEEYDLYPGEQNDLLVEVLEKTLKTLKEGSRPYHLVSSILEANSKNDSRKKVEEAIVSAFNGNGGLSSDRQIRELEAAGFTVTKAGGHYKITFGGDDRYWFTVSATPSDHRTGENMISEITRILFSK